MANGYCIYIHVSVLVVDRAKHVDRLQATEAGIHYGPKSGRSSQVPERPWSVLKESENAMKKRPARSRQNPRGKATQTRASEQQQRALEAMHIKEVAQSIAEACNRPWNWILQTLFLLVPNEDEFMVNHSLFYNSSYGTLPNSFEFVQNNRLIFSSSCRILGISKPFNFVNTVIHQNQIHLQWEIQLRK